MSPRELTQVFSHLFLAHFPDYRQFHTGIHSYGKASETETAIQTKNLPEILNFQKQVGFCSDKIRRFQQVFLVFVNNFVVYTVNFVGGVFCNKKTIDGIEPGSVRVFNFQKIKNFQDG